MPKHWRAPACISGEMQAGWSCSKALPSSIFNRRPKFFSTSPPFSRPSVSLPAPDFFLSTQCRRRRSHLLPPARKSQPEPPTSPPWYQHPSAGSPHQQNAFSLARFCRSRSLSFNPLQVLFFLGGFFSAQTNLDVRKPNSPPLPLHLPASLSLPLPSPLPPPLSPQLTPHFPASLSLPLPSPVGCEASDKLFDVQQPNDFESAHVGSLFMHCRIDSSGGA
ncbi:hypothetical protein KSP40_PGU005000 [Platanthera guangdongensis]|uniref:Uncharacterized protein n=1 Tax=Platanthera guangdongensis TaxID=2320717 RepID=A0ABR2LKR7_9ASPA